MQVGGEGAVVFGVEEANERAESLLVWLMYERGVSIEGGKRRGGGDERAIPRRRRRHPRPSTIRLAGQVDSVGRWP